MTIAEIAERLARQHRDSGQIALSAIPAFEDAGRLLFAPGGDGPVLRQPTAPESSPDGDAVWIGGTTSLDGIDVRLEVLFSQEGTDTGLHLTAALPPEHALRVPGLESLAIGGLVISLDVVPGRALAARVAGRVPFGKDATASMPVALEMPRGGGEWVFYGGVDPLDDQAGETAPVDPPAQIPLTLADLCRLFSLPQLAEALPDGLDAVGLTDFTLVLAGTEVSSLAIGLAARQDWAWPVAGVARIDQLRAAVAVTRPFGGSPEFTVDLGARLRPGAQDGFALRVGGSRTWSPGRGGAWALAGSILDPLPVAAGLTLENLTLAWTRSDAGAWSVRGSVGAKVLDRSVQLSVDTEISAEATQVWLKADGGQLTVMDLSAGALVLEDISIGLGLPGDGATGGRPEASPALDLTAGAHLRLGDRVLRGRLSLSDDRGSRRLRFAVDGQARLDLPAPAGYRHPQIVLGGGYLEIGESGAGWHLDGELTVGFANLADRIQGAISATTGWTSTCTLHLDHAGLRLTLTTPPAVLSIPLPDTQGRPPKPLGTLGVRLAALELTAAGSELDLTATLAMRLPPELNDVFGRRSDGSRRDVFVTDRDVRITFRAGRIQGQPGFAVEFPDLPLHVLDQDADGTVHLKLGEAGWLDFTLPQLTCTAGGFHVSVSCHENRDHRLRLPLGFLKAPLRGRLPQPLLDRLPDALPLEAIRLYDDATGLDPHALARAFGLPDELAAVLEALQRAAAHLPARFKDYLRGGMPAGFDLGLDVSPSGSVSLDVAFQGQPIRLLFPMPPGLVGVELTKLSFGEVLGGALFRLNLTATIDVFDLVALGLCAGTSGTFVDHDYLERMGSTLIADNLLMFLVYETGLPIPIPLFCDRVSLQYAGLLVQARTSWSFPEPADPLTLLTTAAGLWAFVSDPSAPFPTGLRLPFVLGESYIGLPPYLGKDRYLGVKGHDVFRDDLFARFADVANGVKFFSLYRALRAIPLEYRAKTVEVTLGPIQLEADWVVCTLKEFTEAFAQAAGTLPARLAGLTALDREKKQLVLQTASADGAAPLDLEDERRVVVLLAGTWAMSRASALQVEFVLVAGGHQGFGTAVRLSGQVAGSVEVDLDGALRHTPRGSALDGGFAIGARGRLLVAGHPLLVVQGESTTDAQGDLELRGQLQVLPGVPELAFAGEGRARLSRAALEVTGQVRVAVMGVTGSASFQLDQGGFRTLESIRGSLFGLVDATLTVSGTSLGDRASLQIRGAVTSHLEQWQGGLAAALQDRALTGLQALRGQIARQLAQRQQESWLTWVTTGHAFTDSELRSVDAYLSALQAALTTAKAVAGVESRIVAEVAARLGPLGPVIEVMAGGKSVVSLESATFVVGLHDCDTAPVTLTVTGTLLGKPGTWTVAADLHDPAQVPGVLLPKLLPGLF